MQARILIINYYIFWIHDLNELNPIQDAFVGSDGSDSACKLTNTDGILTLEHGLEECGTSMSYDEQTQKIVFAVSKVFGT